MVRHHLGPEAAASDPGHGVCTLSRASGGVTATPPGVTHCSDPRHSDREGNPTMTGHRYRKGDRVRVARVTRDGRRVEWEGYLLSVAPDGGFELRGVCLSDGQEDWSYFSGPQVLADTYGCEQTVTVLPEPELTPVVSSESSRGRSRQSHSESRVQGRQHGVVRP